MTNASTGNSVLDYTRNADGTLTLSATVSTGGKGSGVFLNSAGPVTLHPTLPILFVVNAGDNTVSSFLIGSSGLSLVTHISSGGVYPVSVTAHNRKVYVLNQGSGNNNISGFNLNITTGALSKLAGSTQPLSSTNAGAAQVSFTRNGAFLIVTEKFTNYIDVFPVSSTGVAGPLTTYNSGSGNPYGFVFDGKARVYITDGQFSGLSSYSVANGVVTPISSYVADNSAAACWIAINSAGTIAYVINNQNAMFKGGVSVYSINTRGQVTLNASETIAIGPGGTDTTLTPDGANLYYTVIGGGINAFTVNADGSLTQITSLTGQVSTIEGMASISI